jgi:predicted DNA-binding WGR domain protein
MAIVSSIRHYDITNDYNDGANSLKNFLQYAEAISKGDSVQARRVLENLNPLSRKALAPLSKGDAVVEQIAAALRQRGHVVDLNVGQSRFRCDLALRGATDHSYQLGILVDTDSHYANPNLLDRYLMQPSILRAFGWRFALILTKDWYHNPDDVLARLEKMLQGKEEVDKPEIVEEEPVEAAPPAPPPPPVAASASPAASAGEPPASTKTATPDGALSSIRYFEFIGGSSRKFWEVSIHGAGFTVRFGRIGTMGQSQTKNFSDETKANHEAENLIAEKLKKGYVEKAQQ